MTSPTRLLAVALAAAALTACASTPNWPPGDSYFIGTELVHVEREHLHRYMCANGAPIICRCASMRLGGCDCHC